MAIDPVQTLAGARIDVPPQEPIADIHFLRADLFDLLRKLQLTLTVVMAAVRALEHQAAEQDEDIAQLLKRYVCDALGVEIKKMGSDHARAAASRGSGCALRATNDEAAG